MRSRSSCAGAAAAPVFHLLDTFFGRSEHATVLGKEMVRLRAWYPRHWRELVDAVGAVSVARHVAASGDRVLDSVYRKALEAYAGEDGYLARHRLKVYGYLELAFKVGRTLTIGGRATRSRMRCRRSRPACSPRSIRAS